MVGMVHQTRCRNVTIDRSGNNATERAIRGVAVGRNNWIFFGSDHGGNTAAILQSFVASCQPVSVIPSSGSKTSYPASPPIPVRSHNFV